MSSPLLSGFCLHYDPIPVLVIDQLGHKHGVVRCGACRMALAPKTYHHEGNGARRRTTGPVGPPAAPR